MSAEEIQRIINELGEFRKELSEFRKENNENIAKIFDRINLEGVKTISAQKDIEANRLWFEDKLHDAKNDINNLAELFREHEKELKIYIHEQIKKDNLLIKLWITGSVLIGMSSIIMFLLNKFL